MTQRKDKGIKYERETNKNLKDKGNAGRKFYCKRVFFLNQEDKIKGNMGESQTYDDNKSIKWKKCKIIIDNLINNEIRY